MRRLWPRSLAGQLVLIVLAALMVAGGAGPLRGGPENDSVSDLDIDLRVDDAGAPLAELHRLLGLRLWGTSDIASDAWAALGDRSRRC